MRITDAATRHRTSVVVLTLMLIGGGLYSYVALPKESNPSIEIPYINVTTPYPGASPQDVADLITREIEQEIQSINGIKEIRSTSTEGLSSIVVEFLPDVALDDAEQEVRDRVEAARSDLPDDAEDPIIGEVDLSEFPIMTINLAASYSLTRLKELAEDLQDELEAAPGVLEVDISGGLEREVQVDVDLNTLQGYGLSFTDIADAIRRENANVPGGSIDLDRRNYLVRVEGRFESAEEIEDLVVVAPGGIPVYVRDLAEVRFGFKDRESFARLKVMRRTVDGVSQAVADAEFRQVISLDVKKRSGENILETAAAVKGVLETYPMPPGTDVLIVGDQSEQVEELVADLENNIIAGILFVVLVLLVFLGPRNALLVGLAIPMSMLASFLVFLAMGQTLNLVVLFSLIIALGMLVDNAIVIVENIHRFREMGESRWDAARHGTAEVGTAVVASTATTVAAFAPMLFWPGLIGEFMGYMPLTLIVTLSCSLFVALIINPVVTGYFVEDKPGGSGSRSGGRSWRRAAGIAAVVTALALVALVNPISAFVLVAGALLFGLLYRYALRPFADGFVSGALPRLIERYRRFLDWMLRRDYAVRAPMLRNTAVLGAFAAAFVLAAAGLGVGAAVDQTAAMLLLVPAAVLGAVGVIGIFVHALENVYLGGRTSVAVAVVVAAAIGLIAGLTVFTGGSLSAPTLAALFAIPALCAAIGLAGAMWNRRPHLVLTDNRARLLTATFAFLFLVLGAFAIAPTGVAFFPETDPDQIRITLIAPEGTSVEASDAIAQDAQRRLEELLAANPASGRNVESILANAGVGGDAQFGGGARQEERSRLALNLIDFNEREESGPETLARIRAGLQGIPGVEIEIDKDEQGPQTGPPINIEVAGPDFEEVVRIARDVKRSLVVAGETGAIAGLVDLTDSMQSGRPEIRINIDRERAAQFGLSTRRVGDIVRSAIQGTEATTWRFGEEEYDVRVRLREEDRRSPGSLESLTLRDGERSIPLVSIAGVEWTTGAGSITRLDLDPVVTVSGDSAPGFNSQAVLAQVQAHLAEYAGGLPSGYSISYTGEQEDQQESFAFLTTALAVGAALILFILIAQFNSVSSPIIIMIAVGLGFGGVLVGLMVTRTPFSLFTFIGLISLAGIIVNNNIVLVDYINQLRERGMSRREAILEAGATRLRPVLLTALTTVLGLVPLTFGINIDFVGLLTRLQPNFFIGSQNTQFWGPMGVAIISGLTFGTFLTLVVVPVIYSVFESLAARFAVEGPAGAAPARAALGDDISPSSPRISPPDAPADPAGSAGAVPRPV